MPNYHVVIKWFLRFLAFAPLVSLGVSLSVADVPATQVDPPPPTATASVAAPSTSPSTAPATSSTSPPPAATQSAGIASAQPWDLLADTWVATDGLGRKLPTFDDVGPPKADKTAVMFYYMWLDGRDAVARDMAKALANDPNYRAPINQWWWWGEPVLGYYQNTDPFVNRVHASELADAGIDAIMFDSTNSYTHEEAYLALCKTYADMRAAGLTTPAIGHVTHAKTGPTVQKLYDEFYSKGLYKDLWFMWDGKPLILGDPAQLSPQCNEFFTVRASWAWHDPTKWFGDGKDRWPWIDGYPQQFGWHVDPQTPEQISVSAAQHPSSSIGRSFTYAAGKEPPARDRAPAQGIYFAEQWTQALKISPRAIFITNWNEWIAKSYGDDHPHGKPRKFIDHELQKGEGFFVDEYDPEFSRDIEPAKPTAANRGVDDNYYYQLVANLRQYKGARPLASVNKIPITVDGRFDDWAAAAPEYRDTIGDPAERDFAGYDKGTRYVNHTGRNDIVAAKVSFDAAYVYFYVRTKTAITPAADDDWMLLYLDTDQNASTGWLGYDFVVNRLPRRGNTAALEKCVKNQYDWTPASDAVQFAVAGNEMELAVPIASIAGADGKMPEVIDFKWADRCQGKHDWTDFTLNGDAAPNARFNYRAKFRSP